jgi:hypothetical protein
MNLKTLKEEKKISLLHEKSVIIKDLNGKVIEELSSQLKAADYLGVDRKRVNRIVDTGKVLDSKLGPVYINFSEASKNKARSIKVEFYDSNNNLLEFCSSLRDASTKYGISASAIRLTYLNKDRLFKDKYYFVELLSTK